MSMAAFLYERGENMKKAAIFDLDGTLLYSLEDLGNSTNAALREYGFPERSLEEVRRFVGNGVAMLIHRAVPLGTDASTEAACLKYFQEYYQKHMQDRTRPYDGILNMLDCLHGMGIQTGILSNKFHQAVCTLSRVYFGDRIDVAQGEQPGIPRKPDPAGLNQIMRRLGVLPEETLYLGDSPEDALTAQNAGVEFMGVTWGYRTLGQLREAGTREWINRPEELAVELRQKTRGNG